MYVNVYVYVYMYLPKCELYLYPFLSLPTYLPTKRSSTLILLTKKSKLHRSPFLILPLPSPSRSRVRVCMCIYELIEGFSSLSYPVRTSPRPSAPLPPKKKKTFASAASPPSPCDGSSHIQSQLDKARQGKTRQGKLPACLPACKKN